jgi:uncharacterized protein (AIM24 family)
MLKCPNEPNHARFHPEPIMTDTAWYWAKGQQQIGPLTLEDLAAQIISQVGPAGAAQVLVFGPGLNGWVNAGQAPAVANALRAAMQRPSAPGAPMGNPGPPPPVPTLHPADAIGYEIIGNDMQYVVVRLEPGHTAIADAGSMMFMTSGVRMDTVMGDPSTRDDGGFLGKLMTAGKRALTGSSLFITTFTNAGSATEKVAFAAPFPGKVIALDLSTMGGEVLCQKHSLLCAARGVSINIAFQKNFGAGIFGGEGFILQRLIGSGVALIHGGGEIAKHTLGSGEILRIETGCVAAMSSTINFDIQFVGGLKNTLFGGEGIFFAVLTGPGDVWMQSLPFSRLAGRIASTIGHQQVKTEVPALGALGALIDMERRS